MNLFCNLSEANNTKGLKVSLHLQLRLKYLFSYVLLLIFFHYKMISCAVHKPNQFTGYNMITNSENPLPLLLFHRFQILHQILIFFASILGSPKKPIQLIVYIPIRQNSQCNCSQLQ